MCEGVFPFPPMLSASPHWGRPNWSLTQKLKPLLPGKAEFCLCMGQAHALGKTEPFPNLRRQNLTGLSQLWLFYLFCIDWLRNNPLIHFLRLEGISARKRGGGSKGGETILLKNESSLRRRHRDPERRVSSFWLCLFMGKFSLARGWECTTYRYGSHSAISWKN